MPRLFGGRPPHEIAYLNSLFGIACPTSENISGADVVAFFKRSKLEMVSAACFESKVLLILLVLAFDRGHCVKFGHSQAC